MYDDIIGTLHKQCMCNGVIVQVGKDNSCPHLNSADGERALLIKDSVGDWGIVHGKWLGFRKGVPGKPGTLEKSYRSEGGEMII